MKEHKLLKSVHFMLICMIITIISMGLVMTVHAEDAEPEEPLGPVYEQNADGSYTLTAYYAAEDEQIVNLTDASVDDAAITSVGAGVFSESPSVEEFYMPLTVTSVDKDFLAGSNIVSINIPPHLSGTDILGGSIVENVYFDEGGRDSIPEDLLFNKIIAPAEDEEFDESQLEERYYLKSVSIYENISEIGDRAFAACTNLAEFNNLHLVKKIGREAFASCSSLTLADISATEIGESAFNYSGLETLYINMPGKPITIGDYAFQCCYSLNHVELSCDVTYIGKQAFNECINIEEIWLPDADIGEEAFSNTGIRTIMMDYDEGRTETVIGKGAFSWCRNLESVQLSENVKRLPDDAFSYCYALSSIDFSQFESIGNNAFNSCGFSGTLNVPTSGVGESAFSNCRSVTKVAFYHNEENPGTWAISKSEFSGCSNLTEIGFVDGLTVIGNNAFSNTALPDLKLPAGNISVEKMAFAYCKKMVTAELNPTSLSLGPEVFIGCEALTTVVFTNNVSSIGEGVFKNCTALKVINIPSGIKEIPKHAFYRCQALQKISIPEGIRTIGEEAFFNCAKMTRVDLPNSLQTIGTRSFAVCIELSTVTFGNGLKTLGESAFETCTKFTGLELPASVTEIGDFCFKDCESLYLDIPDNSNLKKVGAGFLYRTKESFFRMMPGVEYRKNTYTPFPGCYKKPQGELGALSGSSIKNLNVDEDVREIPDSFYSNEEPDGAMVIVAVFGPNLAIGPNAFKNAGTMAFNISFMGGLPSSIASDAFMTDDQEHTLEGYCSNDTPDVMDWGDFPNHFYGRTMRWVNGLKVTEEGLTSYLDGDTLYVVNNGSTVDIPDYNFAEDHIPPWYDESCKALKVQIAGKIRTIGAEAFANSSSIREVTICSAVKKINRSAFDSQPISVVTFLGSFPELDSNVFSSASNIVCYHIDFSATWDPVCSMAARCGELSEYYFGANKVFWEYGSFFKLVRDTNSMRNTNKQFNGDYFSKNVSTIQNASTNGSEKSIVWDQSQKRDDYGICFGLSATMMLHRDGKLSHVLNSSTPYGYLKTDENFKDIVKYYHLLQYAPSALGTEASTTRNAGFLESKNKKRIENIRFFEKLVSTVNDCGMQDKACVLEFGFKIGNEVDHHAVVCCGAESGDFDGDGSTEIAIRIFDCNTVNSSVPTRYCYMYIAEDYSWFSFKDAKALGENLPDISQSWVDMDLFTISQFDKSSIRYPADNKNARSLKKAGAVKSASADETGHITIAVPAYKSYTLRNSAGQTIVSEDGITDGDMEVYDVLKTGEDSLYIVETDPSESFEVSNIDEDFTFTAEMDGLSYLANVSNADSIQISKDKGIEITGGKTTEYEVSVTELENNNAFTMVKGTTGGNVSFVLHDGEFVVKGDDLSDVNVTSASYDAVKERELSVTDGELDFGLNKDGEIRTKEEMEKEEEEEKPVDPPVNPPAPVNKTVKVSGITLSGISKNIAAGKSIKLTAAVTPSNATNKKITWKSSNTKVATVDQTGKVTVLKKTGGKSVTITAAAADGSGKKVSYTIKSMKGAVKKITVKAAKKTVAAGKTVKVKAKVTAGKGANKKLMWKSSNPAFATVNAKGVVKTLKAGKGKTVTITAYSTDGTNKKKSVKIKIK